jgi:hypothetical protein
VNAIAVDGGASYDAADSIGWLKDQRQWHVLGYEPLPRNCHHTRTVLSKFHGRGQVRCSALSDSEGLAKFVDERAMGDMWGSLSFHPNDTGHSETSGSSRLAIQVNATTLDFDLNTVQKDAGVYLLKRVQLVEPTSICCG